MSYPDFSYESNTKRKVENIIKHIFINRWYLRKREIFDLNSLNLLLQLVDLLNPPESQGADNREHKIKGMAEGATSQRSSHQSETFWIVTNTQKSMA